MDQDNSVLGDAFSPFITLLRRIKRHKHRPDNAIIDQIFRDQQNKVRTCTETHLNAK
jgi:hypothetical protein